MSVINDMISRVLNVRSMAAADLPRVLQLEKQRLRSSWLQHDIATNSPARDRGTWVATIQNHVVGYLVYQLITEPETTSSKVAGKAAKLVEAETLVAPPMVCVDLLHIFVAPDWRRRGIGTNDHGGIAWTAIRSFTSPAAKRSAEQPSFAACIERAIAASWKTDQRGAT